MGAAETASRRDAIPPALRLANSRRFAFSFALFFSSFCCRLRASTAMAFPP